ncbi:ABC transporter permease [uncultured Pontibacter sp.]|uniref:ABC transporter permease n=1 Tax=uncultured Pontibacter sp. TaxID=453356 RepID=UPI00262E550C|nr:ABC transporter permease [uncultured Pontibacter sp.]
MKHLIILIKSAWQSAPAFRLALSFLLFLGLVAIILPWLPLPFQPNELDLDAVYTRPFDWTRFQEDKSFHWLGTDGLGRDLLSNLAYGTRSAFAISLPVMLLASLLGLLLGAASGFYGDRRASISRGRKLMLVPALFFFLFYALYVPLQLTSLQVASTDYWLAALLALAVPALLVVGIGALLKRIPYLKAKSSLPLDGLVLRLIEIETSIPRLVLILALAALFPPTLMALSILLVLTFWTGPARLARAEMLRIRTLPFFEAATSLGVPESRLMVKHALPHLLPPVAVAFSFGLAGLLMLESTLSFLNIGVSSELVSWGRIIAGIRANTSAWWLVVIPGATLSATVLALQTCSYYLLRASQHRVS